MAPPFGSASRNRETMSYTRQMGRLARYVKQISFLCWAGHSLVVVADVLLMDEPFSAVDEQTRRKFQEDLLHLLAVEKKTVIFVTHSIEEAVYISDQIVVLSSVSCSSRSSPSAACSRRSRGTFRWREFWALTLILFVFALGLSALVGWLEHRVEYYAGSRI